MVAHAMLQLSVHLESAPAASAKEQTTPIAQTATVVSQIGVAEASVDRIHAVLEDQLTARQWVPIPHVVRANAGAVTPTAPGRTSAPTLFAISRESLDQRGAQ
jgi:hypothetical protein